MHVNMCATNKNLEEEIKHWIILGNKAYFANVFVFKSILTSNQTRMELYWSTMRPVVTYTIETRIISILNGQYWKQ